MLLLADNGGVHIGHFAFGEYWVGVCFIIPRVALVYVQLRRTFVYGFQRGGPMGRTAKSL